MPYLNGGLFERDFAGVEQLDFPAPLVAALLEFFGQYHFTIDENDPEMLGHIFENLLEDNKDKGAYYTPKAVVQYMCQQSLIHALAGHFEKDDIQEQHMHPVEEGERGLPARSARHPAGRSSRVALAVPSLPLRRLRPPPLPGWKPGTAGWKPALPISLVTADPAPRSSASSG